MKTIEIQTPEGYEIDREKSTFERIIFKEIKPQLPNSWEEVREISGAYVGTNSSVATIKKDITHIANKNLFKTTQQAEASIALAQLSQLRDIYRQGWEPDWTEADENKFVIVIKGGVFQIYTYYTIARFLSFQSKEIAEQFLENFRDLIEQATPLMS